MTQSPKKRKLKTKPKLTDKKQSERFIETAREVEAGNDGGFFRMVFEKIVPTKPKQNSG